MTEEELAAAMGISPHKVTELIQASQELVSLDLSAGEDEDSSLSDFIEDRSALAPPNAAGHLLLKEQIEALERELQQIEGAQPKRFKAHSGAGRRMSAAGRRRISEAQRARWAKHKGSKSRAANPKRGSSMSAAGRAMIAAAQRRRWARVRAAKS